MKTSERTDDKEDLSSHIPQFSSLFQRGPLEVLEVTVKNKDKVCYRVHDVS